MSLLHKQEKLEKTLAGLGRMAIAFSGGVDSSFLAKTALDVLGPENVLLLFARSPLVPEPERQRAECWPVRHGYERTQIRIVDVEPLAWKDFTANSEKRCYQCKLRMYQELLEVVRDEDLLVLADGTNTDDLKEHRPGLQALLELGVHTPLVEALLNKEEIRLLSRTAGLDSWDRPSASCLATRIAHGIVITRERLKKVEDLEAALHDFGLQGCRARLISPQEDTVVLQLQARDLDRLGQAGFRRTVLHVLRQERMEKVLVDLVGRK